MKDDYRYIVREEYFLGEYSHLLHKRLYMNKNLDGYQIIYFYLPHHHMTYSGFYIKGRRDGEQLDYEKGTK